MRPRTLLGAIARDEQDYLDEWLEHHLQLGFDRIVVYDNDSWPPLRPAQANRRVEVRAWPASPGVAPQVAAYDHCLAHDGPGADWAAFLDLDEFLNLKRDRSLAAFLSRFGDADGVAVNWRVFGSAGLEAADGRRVLQRFTRAAPRDFWPNTHVKTLFRPCAAQAAGVHGPAFRPSARLVNARGERLALGAHLTRGEIAHEVAQVNHYFTKSRAEFERKRARGRADLPDEAPDKHRLETEFALHDRNDEEDLSILHRPRRRLFG